MLIADSLSIKNRTDIPYLQDAIIFIWANHVILRHDPELS